MQARYRLSTMTRTLLLTTLLLTGLSTGACSSGDEGADQVDVRDDPAPKASLVVTLAADAKGSQLRTWTLTCEPTGGNHPDPAGACRDLKAAKQPFAPVPRDAICTEIYGGSAVATLKGTWYGETVDATYSRENGCQISRYDALGAVLPGPPPGQPLP